MNYIGSKRSLLQFIEESINEVTNSQCKSFCDLFAGTGIVGLHFKKLNYQVIANDLQYYSYVLNRHYIGNHKELEFKKLTAIIPELENIETEEKKNFVCQYLSQIKGKRGFIYNNYSLEGTKDKKQIRLYFSDNNARQCDAIRQKIEAWKKQNLINEDEYYFLLTSLLESIDKYANTASVYGAFLKKLKKSAQRKFSLEPASLSINNLDHQVLNQDANEIISEIEADILYLDPPYNQRQYATNYHLLETIAKYDNPKIHGKTGLREYQEQKSLYCSKAKVKEAFKDLIAKTKAKYIFLSYNNEGLMSFDEIKEIMETRGKYGCFTQKYGRFKADKKENRNYKADKTVEYLHYVVVK